MTPDAQRIWRLETELARALDLLAALTGRQSAAEQQQWQQWQQQGGASSGASNVRGCYLASGTITAASGASLGTGTAVLCSDSGGSLTATTTTVTLWNYGGAITGPVYFLAAPYGSDWTPVVVPC